MDSRLHSIILTALFAGTSAAIGYLFIAIPNVEAFTCMLFLAGWTLGIRRGLIAGLVAALIYFGLNPQGTFPPLLIAQIIGSLSSPLAGFFLRNNTGQTLKARLVLGLAAMIITLWYDFVTNLAYPIVAGFDWNGVLLTLAAGLIFSLVHVNVNILIFIIVLPHLMKITSRYKTA